MIQDLKSKISHFRSELLMGKYDQATQEGDALKKTLASLIKSGIEV